MDQSTERVTLNAVFLQDILSLYRDKPDYYLPLAHITAEYDLSDPQSKIPISVYNQMCAWIEENLGQANTRKVGRLIGKTAFDGMRAYGLISDKPTPMEVMAALVKVAQQMIQDPRKRGWEIRQSSAKSLLMRRTQTFNGTLQFGLLETLVYKSNVFSPEVTYAKSIAEGDEYDEYLVSWK